MSPVSRTNQTLYYAKTMLVNAQGAGSEQEKAQCEEVALYHLFSTLSGFANELVKQYSLPAFKDLSELFSRPDLPAELKEFALLYEQQAWPYELLKQYQRVSVHGFEQGLQNSNLIMSQSDYTELFRNWLIELEKTISRTREHYQEY